ncbi:hypothetical protein ACWCQK_05270 [Streptomyces sp. NPDC002306]
MFGKKLQQSTDLTSPKAVKKSQRVYDRIASGKCRDVAAELDATHGRKSK